ncbi:glycoside hydrolase family 5 protein [Maricaulaceae bacterium NA33B04]|nr:glycoside hydrolase family 5 protein [Maricaulaceae bacterium NA33B04]
MKLVALCLAAFVLVVGTERLALTQDNPLTAREAADRMGRGFNLGQMFDNDQHEPSLANARAKIDAYYALGFRNLRIPVTWTEEIDGYTLVADFDVGNLDTEAPRFRELLAVIDYALSKPDLFVVVNMHHEDRLKAEYRYQVFQRLWRDIATELQDRDHRLIFELLNEPHIEGEPMAPERVRHMSELAYQEIRAIDAERIVIIGGNQWMGAQEMAVAWPDLSQVGGGEDEFLMATFHHYNPWDFNGEDGDKTHLWTEADIVDPIETMEAWARTTGQGMPVFIGEWGNGWGKQRNSFNCNNVRALYEGFDADYASQRTPAMPTAVWDDGGWFMSWDHETHSFANDLAQCITSSCLPETYERVNADC